MRNIYETDRLVLKGLDKTYADMTLDYFTRNKDFFEEWDPHKGDDFYTREYQEELLDREAANSESGSALNLWIFKKDDNKRIIGYISFGNIVRGPFLSCYLGYKLDKDEVNKGYVTEAIRMGIDIVFDEYGLHRIEANIMPKNKRSLRVVEKLGFYHEGLAYKYLKINGEWEDHIHMVLLNEKI